MLFGDSDRSTISPKRPPKGLHFASDTPPIRGQTPQFCPPRGLWPPHLRAYRGVTHRFWGWCDVLYGGTNVKHSVFAATALAAAAFLVMPFSEGSGAVIGADGAPAAASSTFIFSAPAAIVKAGAVVSPEASASKSAPKSVSPDGDHVAQNAAPAPSARVGGPKAKAPVRRTTVSTKTKTCPANIGGSTNSAPGAKSKGGVQGTTSSDVAAFALKMNAIRVANCLEPIPLANIKYDSCMEQRLFWMAEDPSTNPNSAWGHIGSKRSDGVPSVGCDGNIAGGSGNTGATVAQKWWDSPDHRSVEYRPTFHGNFGSVCILFAMTHGGLPNESASFTRAASRWVTC